MVFQGGTMSDRTPRLFTTEFKERAVLRLEAGEQFSALAGELGVRRKLLYDWCKAYRQLDASKNSLICA
jgi:transposase-like protein